MIYTRKDWILALAKMAETDARSSEWPESLRMSVAEYTFQNVCDEDVSKWPDPKSESMLREFFA